ncbi:hypothetical protein [Streptomyces olivoreticuli]|nr:hypothetical protein [Streptomyces olivoreticuli]
MARHAVDPDNTRRPWTLSGELPAAADRTARTAKRPAAPGSDHT